MGYFAVGQNTSCSIIAFFERRGLTIDQATRSIFVAVIQEPCFAQHTGTPGFDDVVILDRQFNVIAHAAAEGASRILNDLQFAGNAGCWSINLS